MPTGVYQRPSLVERFETKVNRNGPVHPIIKTRCHLWTGSIHKVTGYGQIRVGGAPESAHRVAWKLKHGPIPDGLLACHQCDNRACVNDAHLFLGTHADNDADKVAKDRQAKGITFSHAKLTEDDVLSIRRDRRTQREIASAHGVSQAIISGVKNGKRWAHVR